MSKAFTWFRLVSNSFFCAFVEMRFAGEFQRGVVTSAGVCDIALDFFRLGGGFGDFAKCGGGVEFGEDELDLVVFLRSSDCAAKRSLHLWSDSWG